MGYKTFVSMNIAVIGNSSSCENIAENLALAGHTVFIGLKTETDPFNKELTEVFNNIQLCDIVTAAALSDLVIIATEPKDVRQVAYLLDDVRTKVIIDASSDVTGRPEDYIHTVNAIKAITGSPHVVKCFDCTRYGAILKSFFKDKRVDMLVAGDSKKAKEIARIMAYDMGYSNCYDFGNNSTVQLLDEMTRHWYNYAVRNGMAENIAVKQPESQIN